MFNRFPEPTSHSFILEFLKCRAPHNTKADRQVGYILDLMKLDVPDLFCYQQSGTSIPGENFKKHLQTYIATSGLSLRKELLRRVDAIMVSWSLQSKRKGTCNHMTLCLSLNCCFRIAYMIPLMVFKTSF